jgi:uncharacterized membrane protein YhaH (DUF805 family)
MTSPTGPDGHEPPAQGYPGYTSSQGYPGYGSGHGYVPTPTYTGAPTYNGAVLPFPDAVRSVLTQYATFTGRARRSEYWWFALFNLGLSMVAAVLDAVVGATIFELAVALGLLVPSFAVFVRRLHDIGRSGWWLLIGLVPLAGAVILIVFACTDSERGANRWGPSPKYGA